jgi:glutathione synthase/RimK-type ligase-like ATP-grasp enzyme
MSKNTIGIYYEHPEWFRSLFAALESRGLAYEKIDAANHFYNPDAISEYPLFFNRMSASAYLRGHGNAIFFTRGLLASLERAGVRVINGYEAFQIEISKALQTALFASLGVKFPKTCVVNSVNRIIAAAKDLRFPVIVKPNIGGRGAGIVKFDSLDELHKAAYENQLDLGIDSTALVQEFVPKAGGHINRVETLNGKFLYALKIYPQGENFNLCPAEVCLTENQPLAAEICLTDAPQAGLKIESFVPPAEIIETVERIAAAGKIDVGGVEYLTDERSGDTLFYDINALSNFVADAENLIGFNPHNNLVEFLEQELERCVTDTGCRFSAVG